MSDQTIGCSNVLISAHQISGFKDPSLSIDPWRWSQWGRLQQFYFAFNLWENGIASEYLMIRMTLLEPLPTLFSFGTVDMIRSAGWQGSWCTKFDFSSTSFFSFHLFLLPLDHLSDWVYLRIRLSLFGIWLVSVFFLVFWLFCCPIYFWILMLCFYWSFGGGRLCLCGIRWVLLPFYFKQ